MFTKESIANLGWACLMIIPLGLIIEIREPSGLGLKIVGTCMMVAMVCGIYSIYDQ